MANFASSLNVDVGGTFTDVIYIADDHTVRTLKIPSRDGSLVADILRRLDQPTSAVSELRYSTTVMLNALLSGSIARIGLIVTKGFREMLETAKLPETAGLSTAKQRPASLVALEDVREVSARLTASGAERAAVDQSEVENIVTEFIRCDIDVIAISLLHSYANPDHELQIAAAIQALAPQMTVICSTQVLPELREYERTLVTALNASLVPLLTEQTRVLFSDMAPVTQVSLMQANGGLVGGTQALRKPLTTAIAGPSAAVVGMQWLGAQSGYADFITLDVGGTSTDVARIADGRYTVANKSEIAGFELPGEKIDVLSIGAGGGSIAYVAPDKRWHVGPQSAGAAPGPACYDLGGEEPTLTDAHLALGRLPVALLGGNMPLDYDAAINALAKLGESRGLDAQQTAQGVLEIATHHMCGAIRRVSVSRGFDPADHALIASGGAGPLHAAELATLLGMHTVIVPTQPGLATAWGLSVANVANDFVSPLGINLEEADAAQVASNFDRLSEQGRAWLVEQHIDPQDIEIIYKMDCRYAGMTHDSTIICPPVDSPAALLSQSAEAFHQYFENFSGRSWRDQEHIEIINLRVTACGHRHKPALCELQHEAPIAAQASAVVRQVGFLGLTRLLETSVYQRGGLKLGQVLIGPTIVEQHESTTVVPPNWQCKVDNYGNLILSPITVAA